MEKKIETLAELKGEKMRLREKMDEEKPRILLDTAKEYSVVLALIDEVESRVLRPIVIGILLCLILTLAGCISNTLDGMRQDIHNASRPAEQAKWTK